MAGLKIFVSSTCYDLSIVREQIRTFIESMGYEPVMSDYNDILYDPRIHTHTSCVDEVTNCDMVLLIIGSRYGGKGVTEALSRIDFSNMYNKNKSIEELKKADGISVTQLEVLKAVEDNIPIYTFIENKVWHDHKLYEKNKEKEIIGQIFFPSIEKQETAKYIFNFINVVRFRTKGNSIFTFTKIQEIQYTLKKQWSNYFQRLLNEQKHKLNQEKQIDSLNDKFEELKTAILTSIGTGTEKDIARGVVRYRHLIDFVRGLKIDISTVYKSEMSWNKLLEMAGIINILDGRELVATIENSNRLRRFRVILLKNDDTFFEYRNNMHRLNELASEWESFMDVKRETRSIIVDALLEMGNVLSPLIHHSKSLNYYLYRTDDLIAVSDEED